MPAVLDWPRISRPELHMSVQTVREPRWPAFVAMLAAAGVYLALPAPLSLGPSWLLLLVIVLLLIPIVVSDRRGHHNVTRISHARRQSRHHHCHDCVLSSFGHWHSATSRGAEGTAAFGDRTFGSPIFSYSHSGTGSSTLAVRCGASVRLAS